MRLLDVIFPKRCVNCGRVGSYVCPQCTLLIRAIRENEAICPVCERPAIDGATHPGCRTRYTLDGLTSFFRYDGPVRKAVKTLKYRFVSDLAAEFVSLIPASSFDNVAMKQCGNDCIFIPIPLHPSRFRQRGYNQAEVLGKLIAVNLGIPLRTDILKRARKTTPQVAMKKREARLKNMENVFVVSPNILVSQYPHVILFDDVFTTGATMRSAANAIKRKVSKFVWAVTMAR